MERIRLSKNEKNVMRFLKHLGHCPSTFPVHQFSQGVEGLERKGFAKASWASGHELFAAELTSTGEAYYASNPNLRNPIDWKWVIGIAIPTLISLLALFVSCINNHKY